MGSVPARRLPAGTEGEMTMHSRTRRVANMAYRNWVAVVLFVVVIALLGGLAAISGVIDPTKAGLLAGLAWALAALYLDFYHPQREDVPSGVLSLFYIFAAIVYGMSIINLPAVIRSAITLAAGALAPILLLIVMFVLDDPEDALEHIL